jgi:hypothetical protein
MRINFFNNTLIFFLLKGELKTIENLQKKVRKKEEESRPYLKKNKKQKI